MKQEIKKLSTVRMNENIDNLAYKLLDKGYETFLLSANVLVHPYFGFHGFTKFYDLGKSYQLLSKKEMEKIAKYRHEYKLKTTEMALKLLHHREYKLLIKGVVQSIINRPIRKLHLDKGAINAVKLMKKIITTYPK